MKTPANTIRHLAFVGAVTLGLLVAALPAPAAKAAFIFTVVQVGDDVVVTGSGSINTTDLTEDNDFSDVTLVNSGLEPDKAVLSVGTSGASLELYTGFTGPANFGTESTEVTATSGDGDVVGLLGTPQGPLTAPTIFVPRGLYIGEPADG